MESREQGYTRMQSAMLLWGMVRELCCWAARWVASFDMSFSPGCSLSR